MRDTEGPRRPSSYWPIVAVFVAMTALQATAALFSIQLLSTVRAYVAGESLYSKGQKDAQTHLLNYAEQHREEDYASFVAALAVPLGDGAARVALERSPPDERAARRGFLQGGNHPDDIDGVIRLFRWFQRAGFISASLATWAEGDAVIAQMQALADQAREHILAGDLQSAAVDELRARVPSLNQRLSELTGAFSAKLGEASRSTQRILVGLNLAIAVLLTVTGVSFVRQAARRQAATEAEVVDRQQSMQRLLDSAAEGLYGVDVEGRCTFVNKAALTMLGYDEEAELLGRDIHALIHHSRADGRPYPASESNVYQAYRARQASHSTDEVLWRRDSTSFPVEYWSHPVLHNDRLQGAVATFFDISERFVMQAALRRNQQRLERLIAAVTDGVVTIDEDRRIVLFNRAAEAMFGIAASEAIGSPVERLIGDPRDYSNAAVDGRSEVAQAGPRSVFDRPGQLHELVGKRRDGTEFPLEASFSRLDAEPGVLTTIVLRDTTSRHAAQAERRAREALEAANHAKTEFLSRMSHELRTPLNAVIGFSQLMRLDTARPLSFEQLERVLHVESAGAHLLALVNDVLDLSRIESGEMAVSASAIPLAEVVEEAATMVSPLVTEAGVEVFLSHAAASAAAVRPVPHPLTNVRPRAEPADEVWVRGDRVRLRQVLVNLLSNAVKYNRPGGSVSLSWRVRGDCCELAVTDTGRGMAPDQLASLFQPFNRLGAEFSTVEGTGIGLVLSRQLAEMMGGTLHVSSTLGEGTTATLTLVTAVAPAGTPHAPVVTPASPVGDRTLNVLYAEDNEVNAELVRQIVTLRRFVSLRVAESGTAALAMARFDPPDLMLVDMHLGDMTGIDLARELKQARATRGTHLVALSADALPEQIDTAMRYGFEAYLTKPIDFAELLALFDRYGRAL
jgi:PAS domain S-box-containing protein